MVPTLKEDAYLVSIIIPCFNMARFLPKALTSISEQNYRNWEIIVVDDCGPEDGTQKAVTDYALSNPSNRVAYIRHSTNLGVSAARNTAIKEARGTYVAFLDPDDYWSPDHLQSHIELLMISRNHPAVSYSSIMFISDATGDIIGEYRPTETETNTFPICLGIRNPINPSGVVALKETIVDIGMFDTTPSLQHVEDWDLWIRLAKAGVAFEFLGKQTAFCIRHDSNASGNKERMYQRIIALSQKHANTMTVWQLDYIAQLQQAASACREHINYLQKNISENPLFRLGEKLKRIFRFR